MKAYTIPLSFSALLLLSACSSQPDEPQLLAQSEPIEMASSEAQSSAHNDISEQDFILASQQQAKDKVAEQFVGTYQSQPTAGLTTRLVLNADHTATTHYDYQNGDKSLVETGYWQQQDQLVHVLMTQHENTQMKALRVFTVDGFQLKAQKEIINGGEYNLGTDGLTLQKMKVETTMVEAGQKSTQGPVDALTVTSIKGSNQYDAKVDATLRRYFKDHRTEPENNHYRWLTYDINNDQQPELFILTDWCGSGGCTILMFENHNNEWRFNSRITQVRTPIQVSNYHHFGWRDLIIPVSGGGAKAEEHIMEYTGVSYPVNASTAPVSDKKGNVTLFSDNISAAQQGIKM
ncbi:MULTISPECIES: hypothetical protein [Vibrio]|uniref:Lipoprotein n=1 Tax=Vibrio casei TaxID=673372 RepID=A0A368LJS7_9VIBR|nr:MULTISPECIES: hypothetical protein [Vibrio]RCS72159.1 hypothetical protein CIK83_00160 [Vibrio casei]SJN21477.1 membrane protein [Vibrio casei]HBV76536.1 hypothetical protein [Vibrio sp.]